MTTKDKPDAFAPDVMEEEKGNMSIAAIKAKIAQVEEETVQAVKEHKANWEIQPLRMRVARLRRMLEEAEGFSR